MSERATTKISCIYSWSQLYLHYETSQRVHDLSCINTMRLLREYMISVVSTLWDFLESTWSQLYLHNETSQRVHDLSCINTMRLLREYMISVNQHYETSQRVHDLSCIYTMRLLREYMISIVSTLWDFSESAWSQLYLHYETSQRVHDLSQDVYW